MYSKQETSKQKEAFWTAFGRYMKPVLSADGEEISWSNYKTGIKGISFKMEADTRWAIISIVLSSSDVLLRQSYYERFLRLKGVMYEQLGEDDWVWSPDIPDEYGKSVSMIGKELSGVNILNNQDWPAIISFLKPRIIALDGFWSVAKYGFEGLG